MKLLDRALWKMCCSCLIDVLNKQKMKTQKKKQFFKKWFLPVRVLNPENVSAEGPFIFSLRHWQKTVIYHGFFRKLSSFLTLSFPVEASKIIAFRVYCGIAAENPQTRKCTEQWKIHQRFRDFSFSTCWKWKGWWSQSGWGFGWRYRVRVDCVGLGWGLWFRVRVDATVLGLMV